MHVVSEAVGRLFQLVEDGDRRWNLATQSAEPADAERQRHDMLPHLVVQLAGNALALPLLRRDQLSHHQLARFPQLMPRAGVRVHAQHAREPSLLVVSRRCRNAGPQRLAVEPAQTLLALSTVPVFRPFELLPRGVPILGREQFVRRAPNQGLDGRARDLRHLSIREHDDVVLIDDADPLVGGFDDFPITPLARSQLLFGAVARADVDDDGVIVGDLGARYPRPFAEELRRNRLPRPLSRNSVMHVPPVIRSR